MWARILALHFLHSLPMKINLCTLCMVLLGLISGRALPAQTEVAMSIHTRLPVTLAWYEDVLGIRQNTIELPQNTLNFKVVSPNALPGAAHGEAGPQSLDRLLVQAGDASKLFLIRMGHSYHITATDSSIFLRSSDPYHDAYDAAKEIVATYGLYRIPDEDLLEMFRSIATRMDSIKATHSGDAYLAASLDYYFGYACINPCVQSQRGPEVVAFFRGLEQKLVREAPLLMEHPLYINFLEHYYTWKSNIKPFSEFQSPERDIMTRYAGEVDRLNNDTITQLAMIANIKARYKGEGSRDADRQMMLIDAYATREAVHPTLQYYARALQEYMLAMALGNAVDNHALLLHTGDSIGLQDYQGSYVLLDFWFVGCGPCRKHIPELKALHQEFGNIMQIIAVNPLESMDAVLAYRTKQEIPYLMAVPTDAQNLKKAFNIRSYPTYILIDPQGNIALFAGSDLAQVRAMLEGTRMQTKGVKK